MGDINGREAVMPKFAVLLLTARLFHLDLRRKHGSNNIFFNMSECLH